MRPAPVAVKRRGGRAAWRRRSGKTRILSHGATSTSRRKPSLRCLWEVRLLLGVRPLLVCQVAVSPLRDRADCRLRLVAFVQACLLSLGPRRERITSVVGWRPIRTPVNHHEHSVGANTKGHVRPRRAHSRTLWPHDAPLVYPMSCRRGNLRVSSYGRSATEARVVVGTATES